MDGQTCGLATSTLMDRGLEGRRVVHPPPESLHALHIAVLMAVLMAVSKAVPMSPLRRGARQTVPLSRSILVQLHFIGALHPHPPLEPAPKKHAVWPPDFPHDKHHPC